MKYKKNLTETIQRFDAWFRHEPLDKPLMQIVAKLDTPSEELENVIPPEDIESSYLDPEYRVKAYRNFCKIHEFMGDAFPATSIDLGAGSISVYSGCEPIFKEDTVWFTEIDKELEDYDDIKFNPDNKWFKKHVMSVKNAVELAKGDFFVNVPDLVENLDILSAMRGPQNLCYDMVDYPELVSKFVNQVDDVYFEYYDAFYDLVKTKDTVSAYTAFAILGHGKTAKLQCDHCALISPEDFKRFVVPSLTKQCQVLDNTLYHLDGPDAIRHIDALMEIKKLDALQWTAGAGQPDGGDDRWFPIYDKVHDANKGIWIAIYDGNIKDWVEKTDKIIKRYGKEQLYFLYPTMSYNDATDLLNLTETKWNK